VFVVGMKSRIINVSETINSRDLMM